MPVRARPSASIAPLVCDGWHATLRRSKTRFDSWQGHSAPSPRVCRTHGGLRSRKAGFDSRVGGWSAVLFRWLSSGCDGRAHDFAKVGDQVRFLARTLPSEGGSKHLGRRSLTAGQRSAKPRKRVRLPPAPLIACPVVPLSRYSDKPPASAMGYSGDRRVEIHPETLAARRPTIRARSASE
jgi:hypothetical protein